MNTASLVLYLVGALFIVFGMFAFVMSASKRLHMVGFVLGVALLVVGFLLGVYS